MDTFVIAQQFSRHLARDFENDAAGRTANAAVDLRCTLQQGTNVVGETWIYQWSPPLKILPDVSGQIAGRSLEEWNAAYVKVENYFHALRIRNKPLLGQLVLRVLERAQRRAPAEPHRTATELAAEEMDRIVTEWFAEVLQTSPTGTDQTLSTRGRLALLLADMPGKWQDQFLRPGPWPEEFVGAMRESFLPRRPGFPVVQNDAAPAGPRPDHHADQFRQAALCPHGAGLDGFCAAARRGFLAHARRVRPGASPGCSTVD